MALGESWPERGRVGEPPEESPPEKGPPEEGGLAFCIAFWAAVGAIAASIFAVDPATSFFLIFPVLGILALLWFLAAPVLWFLAVLRAFRSDSRRARMAWVCSVPAAVVLMLAVALLCRWIFWPSEEGLVARFHDRRERFDEIRGIYRAGEFPEKSAEMHRLARGIGGEDVRCWDGGVCITVWSVGMVPDGISLGYVLFDEAPRETVEDLSKYRPTQDHFTIYRRLDEDWFLYRTEW